MHRGVSVPLAARTRSRACGVGVGAVMLARESGRAGRALAAPLDERIAHQTHEKVHGAKRPLLRAGCRLSCNLRQARGRQRGKCGGDAAVLLKKLVSASPTFCWLTLRLPG